MVINNGPTPLHCYSRTAGYQTTCITCVGQVSVQKWTNGSWRHRHFFFLYRHLRGVRFDVRKASNLNPFPKNFCFNFLAPLSSLLDVFKHLAEAACSETSQAYFLQTVIPITFSVSLFYPLLSNVQYKPRYSDTFNWRPYESLNRNPLKSKKR